MWMWELEKGRVVTRLIMDDFVKYICTMESTSKKLVKNMNRSCTT